MIRFESELVVLRGQRARPFGPSTAYETPIVRTNITNVVRKGTLVQCHVRVAGANQVLALWLHDEQTADRVVDALPKQRAPEFERNLAEHQTFNQALEALKTQSRVTPLLLVANLAVFAWTVYLGSGLLQVNGSDLIPLGTNYGPLTLQGEWWRLMTSMFLHFGLVHLALNMWALWSLGRFTERLYGSSCFLLLYFFAGLCGSFASLYWHPNGNSAGASGAIFGVLGGLLAFMVNPKTRIPASVAAAHRNSALAFILYNLLIGTHCGIDNAAHIGGLFGGLAMGFLLARPLEPESRQNSLPHWGLGVMIGASTLLALWWPLRHGGSACKTIEKAELILIVFSTGFLPCRD